MYHDLPGCKIYILRVQFYRAVYVLIFLRVGPEGIHKTAGRVQISYFLEAMVELTCTIVHTNCQLCLHRKTTVAIEL